MVFWVTFFALGFCLASLVYLWARRRRLMVAVDLIWTVGLGIGGIAYVASMETPTARSWLVGFLLALWAFRLSSHLLKNRVLSGHEDPRYEALAEKWGARAGRNFYLLFCAQIVFAALFLVPVSVAARNHLNLFQWADGLALLVAFVAIAGEWTADRQLAQFRGKPENARRVCREGLWRYSRHPNYFFEWVYWWAFVALSIGSMNWWVSLVGPIAMYCFLRYFTGIPYAERSSLKRRGDAYRLYQQTTHAFFPWRPHKPRT
jgi:steroid 5-alpha reductase family enzyme